MALKWAIRGCGAISGDFVNAFKALPLNEHTVVALCASSIERCAEFARAHQVAAGAVFYDDELKMYAAGGYDVVYVGNLNHQHCESVLNALNHKRAVLCEKPMGVNSGEVRRMVDAARTNNVFLMEAYWTRFMPVLLDIRARIDAGVIGDVRNVNMDFGYVGHFDNKMKPEYGGGQLMATGCYMTMLTMWLFDKPPARVHAVCTVKRNDVDDAAAFLFTYDGGQIATLTSSGSAQLSNKMVISGTKGNIQVPDHFWCPTQFDVYTTPDGGRELTLTESVHRPFSNDDYTKFTYPRSVALSYEAAAVRSVLQQGLKEHPLMTCEHSLHIAKINDEIRRQIGVHFPQDG